MTSRIREALRWSAILLLAGLSMSVVIAGLTVLEWNHWPVVLLSTVAIGSLASIPLFVVAMLRRRDYHQLIVTTAFVASLGLFVVLMGVPGILGIHDYADQFMRYSPGSRVDPLHAFAALSLYFFFSWIFPFWASNRFFRIILGFASRRLYPRPQPSAVSAG